MKKWKSLFACGLVLLLTGWTMLCIPFNAYAQTWEAESTSTNIVAVVDCSTSMQSSDSDWKIRNRWICWWICAMMNRFVCR